MSADLEHCVAPAKVVEKTPHRGLKGLLKCVAGLPPQLVAYQRGIDRIAAVMAGVVAHQGYPAPVRSFLGMQLIYQVADCSTTWGLLHSPLPLTQ